MDYYTRTTFEFQSGVLGAQAGIGGGGRYDELVAAIGGPDIPGVGFGTGVERILLAISRAGLTGPPAPIPTVYVVSVGEGPRSDVFALAHELRNKGVAVELDYMGRSAKGQMKQAGRTGAKYAFIVGDSELSSGTLTVRDLASSEESQVPRHEAVALAEALSRGQHPSAG
jgi:histidyl-tRNA synthetase